MADVFCHDFWEGDGFDRLILKLRASKESLKELSAYFYERAGVEEAYAKALTKVAKQKRVQDETGSLRVAYDAMMSELVSAAEDRVTFASQLKATGDKLMQYKDMQKSVRKNNNAAKDKVDKEVQKSSDALEKYKAAYLKYSDEEFNWREQERNAGLPAKQVQAARKKAEKAEKEKNKYEKLYRDQVAAHHDEQQRWEYAMGQLFTDISCVQVQTYDYIRETLLSYADIERARPPVLAQRLAELTTTIEAIDSDKDIEEWRGNNATGAARPPLVSLFVWSPTGVTEVPQTGGGTLATDVPGTPSATAQRAPPPKPPGAADPSSDSGSDSDSDSDSDDADDDDAAAASDGGPPAPAPRTAASRSSTIGARPKPAPRPPRSASLADRSPPPPVPAAAGDDPPLPAGWTKHWSDEYERDYYSHDATGEVSWERPKPVAPPPLALPAKPVAPPPLGVGSPKPAPIPPKPAAIPPKPAAIPPKPAAIPPKPAAIPPKPAAIPPKPAAIPPKPAPVPPHLANPEPEPEPEPAATPEPKPEPEPAPEAPDSAGAETVTAVYDYDAQYEGELSFVEGDVITVIARDDGGWWEGECNGVRGLFPSNHTE